MSWWAVSGRWSPTGYTLAVGYALGALGLASGLQGLLGGRFAALVLLLALAIHRFGVAIDRRASSVSEPNRGAVLGSVTGFAFVALAAVGRTLCLIGVVQLGAAAGPAP